MCFTLARFKGCSYFSCMRRPLLFAALFSALVFVASNAQDNPAAAAAAREESETRYQRLTSRIDDLEVSFQRFQKDLDKLESQIRGLREQMSRVADNSQHTATQESIKRLADAVEEVDRKRLKDQESVNSALREMEKLILKGGGSGSTPKRSDNTPKQPQTPDKGSGKGYEYTIRSNDNATRIAAALREQKGIKITGQQIIDANPGLDWTKLKIGQKIFIPEVP
jgi:Skp family chaperone for outer membrane proteins